MGRQQLTVVFLPSVVDFVHELLTNGFRNVAFPEVCKQDVSNSHQLRPLADNFQGSKITRHSPIEELLHKIKLGGRFKSFSAEFPSAKQSAVVHQNVGTVKPCGNGPRLVPEALVVGNQEQFRGRDLSEVRRKRRVAQLAVVVESPSVHFAQGRSADRVGESRVDFFG